MLVIAIISTFILMMTNVYLMMDYFKNENKLTMIIAVIISIAISVIWVLYLGGK